MPKKLKLEEFIQKAKEIHGDKYDYSKTQYINMMTKVIIICPIHGEFLQFPNHHIRKHGCPKCANNIKYTTEQFIQKAKEIHGDKYDYSLVNYSNNKDKVCIICPLHGKFYMSPNSHISAKQGCRECRKENLHNKYAFTTEQFIQKAKEIHGDKYDYSLVNYYNYMTPVKIICKKHGQFLQQPLSHLNNRGCPKCRCSKIENDIEKLLNIMKIEYNFHDRTILNNKLELDFYIPSLKIGIECQGLQHFKTDFSWNFNKTNEERELILKNIKVRDAKKFEICKQKNIQLIYYSNLHIKFPYKVITNINEIKKILEECLKKNQISTI